MLPNLSRRKMEMFPLGKTAWAARTVSGGISGITRGFRAISRLLLYLLNLVRQHLPLYFLPKNGNLHFATNIAFDEARLLVTAQNALPKMSNYPFYLFVH